MSGMVKQQVAQIEEVTEASEVQQTMAQLQQMAGQVPPEMKPAIDYLIKKAQARLEALASQPAAQKPKPGQGGK